MKIVHWNTKSNAFNQANVLASLYIAIAVNYKYHKRKEDTMKNSY